MRQVDYSPSTAFLAHVLLGYIRIEFVRHSLGHLREPEKPVLSWVSGRLSRGDPMDEFEAVVRARAVQRGCAPNRSANRRDRRIALDSPRREAEVGALVDELRALRGRQ